MPQSPTMTCTHREDAQPGRAVDGGPEIYRSRAPVWAAVRTAGRRVSGRAAAGWPARLGPLPAQMYPPGGGSDVVYL